MKSKLKLTYERFLAYFGDKLSGKEKHAFEKSVMQDDFESDAFDGLSKLSLFEMQQDLDELKQNLQRKIKSKEKKRMLWLPYAASIIVILGLSSVLYFIKQTSKINEFVSQDIEQVETLDELNDIPVMKQDSMEAQADVKEEERDEMELLDIEVIEDEEVEVLIAEDSEVKKIPEEMKDPELKPKMTIAKVMVEKQKDSPDILRRKVNKSISGEVTEVPVDSQVRIRGVATLSKGGPKMYKHIKGKVVDGNYDPLPGVSIVVKGTTQGVTTDMDGNFKMSLADTNTDYKLTASFVGFEQAEIDIADSLLVVLEHDVAGVNEVIVTAYGAEKEKTYATGSASEVEMDQPIRSWNNAQPANSKNISEYKTKLVSALQSEFANKLQAKFKIKVSFTVLASGDVRDIQIKGDQNDELNQKVIELIRNGEKWIPAEKEEIAIDSKVRFTLRIDFE